MLCIATELSMKNILSLNVYYSAIICEFTLCSQFFLLLSNLNCFVFGSIHSSMHSLIRIKLSKESKLLLLVCGPSGILN